MPSTGADAGSSRPSTEAAAARTTLYRARRSLHTGTGLLTDKQTDRLEELFAADAHVEVEASTDPTYTLDRDEPLSVASPVGRARVHPSGWVSSIAIALVRLLSLFQL